MFWGLSLQVAHHAPILIVGCPRSGTTLLSDMLGQHPETVVHPAEPQFIRGVYLRWGRYVNRVSKALRYIMWEPEFLPKNITHEKLVDGFGGTQRMPTEELVHRYLNLWAGSALQSHVPVLKDPGLVHVLGFMEQVFATPRVIQMVRDPRASISSMQARWPGRTIYEYAQIWKSSLRAGRIFGRRRPDLYAEVTYESLVSDPGEALRSVCRLVGLTYDDVMLEFDRVELTTRGHGPAEPIRFTQADPSRVQHWRKVTRPVNNRLIESFCSSEMLRLDYALDHTQVGAVKFATAILRDRCKGWIRWKVESIMRSRLVWSVRKHFETYGRGGTLRDRDRVRSKSAESTR